jgi:hypothetical protein
LIRDEIKILLYKKSSSITEIAEEMTRKTGKKYTMKSLSQKLLRDTLRASEYKLILDILGYEVVIKQKNNTNIADN